MPRYFFHCADGAFDPDCEGTELADLDTARNEAVRLAAGMLKDNPHKAWESKAFRVEVSDETATLLCTVIVLGIDASAAQGLTVSTLSRREVSADSLSVDRRPSGEM